MTHEYNSYDRCDYIDDIFNVNQSVNDIERVRRFSATRVLVSTVADGSFHVRSTNGLRVTPPISMKVGTRADNA